MWTWVVHPKCHLYASKPKYLKVSSGGTLTYCVECCNLLFFSVSTLTGNRRAHAGDGLGEGLRGRRCTAFALLLECIAGVPKHTTPCDDSSLHKGLGEVTEDESGAVLSTTQGAWVRRHHKEQCMGCKQSSSEHLDAASQLCQ